MGNGKHNGFFHFLQNFQKLFFYRINKVRIVWLTLSSIYTHFNTLVNKPLGKKMWKQEGHDGPESLT